MIIMTVYMSVLFVVSTMKLSLLTNWLVQFIWNGKTVLLGIIVYSP